MNRLVTMFIDYAELMAEDEVLMSMKDWLDETDIFLKNNRREVLSGKGTVSHEAAVKKVSKIYEEFRKKQDEEYISEFDREMEKYYSGRSEP
ncbi:RhuM family protein [Bacteroides heparinolyticus]|uniref:RhuM family protein n=1 Tax=Prevotella heparinolytica TaxID=28113 RepID=UPI00359FF3E1